MSWDYKKEHIVQYRFNSWGLERSLGSYISSFLTNKFASQRNEYIVWSYAEVGFILISEALFHCKNRSLYVANPITHECIKIPSHSQHKYSAWPLGIATRTEKGVLLDYKIVLYYTKYNLFIYSSQTGLWSDYNAVYSDISSLHSTIILHGSLHWVARDSEYVDVIVSFDVYASGTDSIHGRTTPFPDSGKEPRFSRSCSTCQGSLMYMNVVPVTKADGTLEDKLCVWRLKSWEWQLVSEISWGFIDDTGRFDYLPLGINPFDAKRVYFWSNMQQSLLSINLHNGKFVLESKLEKSYYPTKYGSLLRSVVFPKWLHRIPNTVRIV
ncbi:hypothetical protein CARUB_v10019478mg [Capsella rubella]|uniref:F-box protein At3g26010-like beta-propeller domain-containing protein n=2 Tax=Capsella rubella TaxID=81985 RepID=R0HLG2_9BRAS|nr:hypothetical protein CARUB_v10019478mg [Capsella rubella]